jgi:hypothetical protein
LLHFTGARREKFKRDVNLAVYFGQALIQGFPLVGVKKLIPYLINRVFVCCIANFYTFRRPDVKMTEKRRASTEIINNNGEECSGKMKFMMVRHSLSHREREQSVTAA